MNELLIATRRRLFLAIAAGLVLIGTGPLARGGAGATADQGTLAFRAVFSVSAQRVDCPAGTSASVECYSRVGTGIVRGLGTVSESYLYPVETSSADCAAGFFRILSYTARFAVAGKGEIEIAVPGSTECLSRDQVFRPTYPPITIRGGTGAYAGASGSSTLVHALSQTGPGRAAGTDTWVGTLSVPGLEFDVNPPVLKGILGRTVRAPRGATRARVTYTVTARDEVDGPVPVSCRPRSGSRFKIGRTVVTCSAADTSGNRRTARFSVTVRPAR